jgi:TPR repeat protein
MARMLYWGSQGIKRDIVAALDYYRQAAESGDPQALYDYGIVLLKVIFLFQTLLLSWLPGGFFNSIVGLKQISCLLVY